MMIGGNKKFIGLALVGIISIGSIQIVTSSSENRIVEAAQSQAAKNAAAKIAKSIQSINDNYAGIKNQVQWEEYINEGKAFVSKMPSSEAALASQYMSKLDDLQKTVLAIARINHVEKSYEINFKGIKNASQWRTYLDLAKNDMERIDKSVFKAKYEELLKRYNDIEAKVKAIEDAHYADLKKVQAKFNAAKSSNSLADAEAALDDANKLGTHDTSTKIRKEIEDFIKSIGNVNYQSLFKVQEKFTKAKVSKALSDAESALVEANKLGTDKESTKIKDEIKVLINLIKQNKGNTYSDVSEEEKEVARLANIEREKKGLKPAVLDPEYSAVARLRCYDMVYNNYYTHTSPIHGESQYIPSIFGFNGWAMENLFKGPKTPKEAVDGWMNSEGHRNNILYQTHEKVGVGHFGDRWAIVYVGSTHLGNGTYSPVSQKDSELLKVQEKLAVAKISMKLEDAQTALVEVNKISGYESSMKLKKEIESLIETIKQNKELQVSEMEKEVVTLINIEREKNGLKPLVLDNSISAVAYLRSQDMLYNNNYDYNSPTYGSPSGMLEKFGIGYSGKVNLYKGPKTAKEAVNGWMNSQSHKEQILSSDVNLRKIGVGFAEESELNSWTVIFAIKTDGKIECDENLLRVQEKFAKARISKNLSEAEDVLREANKLGNYESSKKIQEDIKELIEKLKQDRESIPSSFEEEVVRLINIERQKNGIKPLVLNNRVSAVARFRAQDRLYTNSNVGAFLSPTNEKANDLLKNFGLTFKGELSSYKGPQTPKEVVKGLLNASHTKNKILSKDFGKIGVGFAEENDITSWTIIFADKTAEDIPHDTNLLAVQEKYAKAKISKNLGHAEEALQQANKLGNYESSRKIKEDINNLITDIKQNREVSLSNMEAEVVRLINLKRTQNGYDPLVVDNNISAVARFKAQDMIYNNYLDYTSPVYGNSYELQKMFGVEPMGYMSAVFKGDQGANEIVEMWTDEKGYRGDSTGKFTVQKGNNKRIAVGYAEEDGLNSWVIWVDDK